MYFNFLVINNDDIKRLINHIYTFGHLACLGRQISGLLHLEPKGPLEYPPGHLKQRLHFEKDILFFHLHRYSTYLFWVDEQ